MALLTCADCGGPVSDRALACPKCGRPPTPRESENSVSELPPAQSKLPAFLVLGFFFFVTASAFLLYRNPGMEKVRAFPTFIEQGQREFEELAHEAMRAVRGADDSSELLKAQAPMYRLQPLFGVGTVVDSGDCSFLTTGRADCEKFVEIGSTTTPSLWIYLGKQHTLLPSAGTLVAFDDCKLTDIGVALGADPKVAHDSAWWLACGSANPPTPIGRDALTMWAKIRGG